MNNGTSPDDVIVVEPPGDLGGRIVLHGLEQILPAVAFLIGVQPGPGDVVVLALRQRILQVSMTFHRPAPRDLTDLWHDSVGDLIALGVDAAYLIAYVPMGATGDLRALAAGAGPLLRHVLQVNDNRWWSFSSPDPDDGPGIALSPLGDAMAASLALLAGGTTPPERSHLGDFLRPGPADLLARLEAELQSLSQEDIAAQGAPDGAFKGVAAAHAAFTAGPLPLSTRHAARLLAAVAQRPVCDRCLPWCDDAAWWLWCAPARQRVTGPGGRRARADPRARPPAGRPAAAVPAPADPPGHAQPEDRRGADPAAARRHDLSRPHETRCHRCPLGRPGPSPVAWRALSHRSSRSAIPVPRACVASSWRF
jgi:hypothetical protein